MARPDPEELTRRLRVIVSYKVRGRDDKARAELLADAEIPEPQYRNWIDKSKPTILPAVDDLVALAEAAGVPRRFAERGFADLVENDPTEVARLRRQVSELERAIQAERADVLERGLEVAEQIAELRMTMARLQSRQQP